MFLPTQVLWAKSQDAPTGQVLKALHPATQAGALLQYCPTGQLPGTQPEIEWYQILLYDLRLIKQSYSFLLFEINENIFPYFNLPVIRSIMKKNINKTMKMKVEFWDL